MTSTLYDEKISVQICISIIASLAKNLHNIFQDTVLTICTGAHARTEARADKQDENYSLSGHTAWDGGMESSRCTKD